jgi:hypothetical protein
MDTNQPSKHNRHSVTTPIFLKTKKLNLSYPNIHVWLLRKPRKIEEKTNIICQILTKIQNYIWETHLNQKKKKKDL